ncbi:hypothetical protein C8J57DRAFT_1723456 [Mycena rebaudengoi]|nr:hypothetical protein C8J57DRAFT_1723456 [Mycena rebaudengoi]
MQFSLVAIFAVFVTTVVAAPAPLRLRQSCDLKTCVLDLAPSVVSCGSAAAQLGVDPFSDAGCLLAAAQDVDQLPASCNGCADQLGLETAFEKAKNAIEGIF